MARLIWPRAIPFIRLSSLSNVSNNRFYFRKYVHVYNRNFSILKFAYQFQSKNSILDHVMHNFKATSKIFVNFLRIFCFVSPLPIYNGMLCRSLVAIDYNLKVISHMQNVEAFFSPLQEEHTYTKAPFD